MSKIDLQERIGFLRWVLGPREGERLNRITKVAFETPGARLVYLAQTGKKQPTPTAPTGRREDFFWDITHPFRRNAMVCQGAFSGKPPRFFLDRMTGDSFASSGQQIMVQPGPTAQRIEVGINRPGEVFLTRPPRSRVEFQVGPKAFRGTRILVSNQ